MASDDLREAVERLAAEWDRPGMVGIAPRLRDLLAEHPPTPALTDADWQVEAERLAEERSQAMCACGTLALTTTGSERHDRGLHGASSCVGQGSWTTRGWYPHPPTPAEGGGVESVESPKWVDLFGIDPTFDDPPEPTEYVIENGWLCEVANEHTCGTAKDGYYGAHEPGCGLIPIADITPLIERERREAGVRALVVARLVERDMADAASQAWRSANARRGLSDHEALLVYADALTRWSERFRMAFDGDDYREDRCQSHGNGDLSAEQPPGAPGAADNERGPQMGAQDGESK